MAVTNKSKEQHGAEQNEKKERAKRRHLQAEQEQKDHENKQSKSQKKSQLKMYSRKSQLSPRENSKAIGCDYKCLDFKIQRELAKVKGQGSFGTSAQGHPCEDYREKFTYDTDEVP